MPAHISTQMLVHMQAHKFDAHVDTDTHTRHSLVLMLHLFLELMSQHLSHMSIDVRLVQNTIHMCCHT